MGDYLNGSLIAGSRYIRSSITRDGRYVVKLVRSYGPVLVRTVWELYFDLGGRIDDRNESITEPSGHRSTDNRHRSH